MTYKYPDRLPFFHFLLRSTSIAKNPIPYHKKWFDEIGDTFAIKSPFYGHIILTRDADVTKHMLQKKHKVYHKSKIQTHYLSKYVGYGLLTSSGDYWLQQRRLIQPAFHKEKIQNLVQIIQKAIERQVDLIKTDGYTDLYLIMNELAFEVVAKSLFDFSADTNMLKRLQFIIEKLQLFIVKELRMPYKKLWYTIKGDIKYHMALVKESRDIINAIITKRRLSKDQHDDLLDMLLHAKYEDGSSMSNTQLIDEILILFVAGHETTANALTFTLKLLAKEKEALKKVEDEIKHVSNQNKSPLQEITMLNYTKCCVEESLRLYPPAWITDRVNIEDDMFNGYYLKKGTIIGASIYELHRNKKYWDKPNTFLPERFLEENRKDVLPYFMPFGAGPRLCIGNNFAMYEMVLTVNAILKRFNIETNEVPIKVNPLITLKPVGVKVKFTEKRKE